LTLSPFPVTERVSIGSASDFWLSAQLGVVCANGIEASLPTATNKTVTINLRSGGSQTVPVFDGAFLYTGAGPTAPKSVTFKGINCKPVTS
jgi:D-tyrosyl-tRNA(Tyr) deacylase